MSWSEPITQLVASLPAEFWLALAVGFAAQLVDGALGMAYGVTASSLLVAFGMPPAIASAIVHAAECFTTGASAVAHRAFGNVDGRLFRRLLPAAAVGAVVGASVAALVPTEWLRPYVSAYLAVMGAVIVGKAFRPIPPPRAVERVSMLGFVGAFLDAVGGGGWGPIVASNLIWRGKTRALRLVPVNAAGFFVTLTTTLAFVAVLGAANWIVVLGLASGGIPAAPIGAWLTRRLPLRPLLILVGTLITFLSVRTLWLSLFSS